MRFPRVVSLFVSGALLVSCTSGPSKVESPIEDPLDPSQSSNGDGAFDPNDPFAGGDPVDPTGGQGGDPTPSGGKGGEAGKAGSAGKGGTAGKAGGGTGGSSAGQGGAGSGGASGGSGGAGPGAVCGDAKCEVPETCESCQADCGSCAPTCKDGTCQTNENCINCPADCGTCAVTCHSICQLGDRLDPGCSSCVSVICEVNSICCSTQWDSGCILQVADVCGLNCN